MKLIRPFTVTDANLTSNIAETDAAEYASTATYAKGAVVMNAAGAGATHKRYESLVDGNVGNALTDTSKWLELGPTNRWAMFDQKNGTSTTGTTIDVSVKVTGRADGLALLGLDATSVSVQMMIDAASHTNLLTYSQDFTNGAWTQENVSVTANVALAPDGSLTAERVSTGTNFGEHRFYQAAGSSAIHGFSIYVKPETASYISLTVGTVAQYALFDLTTGSVVSTAAANAAIEDGGDGWYRISMVGTAAMPGSFFVVNIGDDTRSATPEQGSTGSNKTMLLWGAQLEQASAVSAYIPTTSAPVTTTASTVYQKAYNLQSDSGVTSWYDYFSEDVVYKTDLVITDLPLYTDPTVRVVISGNASVSCGTMVLGQTKDLGNVTYGARAGIQDYSKKSTDDFGNYTIVERSFAKRTVLKLVTDNANIDEIHALLASYRTTPAVWIGADDYACTWVFGFYKDFAVEIAQLQKSYLSLEIEGLT